MAKRGVTELTLRRAQKHLTALLKDGKVSTSIGLGLTALGVSLPEVGAMLRAGEVRTLRTVADGSSLDGPCTVCTVACTTLGGVDVALLVEMNNEEAIICGIAKE